MWLHTSANDTFCRDNKKVPHLIIAIMLLFGSGCSNDDSKPSENSVANRPEFSETITESGDGWQMMHITGTAHDGDKSAYDVFVYAIHGAAGAYEAPLPDFIQDDIGTDPSNAESDSVYILNAEILDEIVAAEQTGSVSQRLQDLAESLDDMSQDGESAGLDSDSVSRKKCDDKIKTKSKSFNLNISQGKSYNLNKAGNIKGTVNLNLNATGSITGEAALGIKRVRVLGLCIPYGVRFDHARVHGSASINSDGGVSGSISWEKSWEDQIAKPHLGSLDFFAGPVPIHLGFNLPIILGLSIKAKADTSLHLNTKSQASGSFDYTCTMAGCTGSANLKSSSDPMATTAMAQLRAEPDLWGQVSARAFLYDEWLAYAQVGLRPHIYGDLWGYIGNTCGDADGDGYNENVTALTLDVDSQVFVNAEAALFGGKPKRWDDLWHTKRYHLAFWDLLGSTAVVPMLNGPSYTNVGTSKQYSAKMRPCWPYPDDVTYTLAWGDGSSSSATSPPQNWVPYEHAWAYPGEVGIQVTADSDKHGRSLANSVTKSVLISCGLTSDCTMGFNCVEGVCKAALSSCAAQKTAYPSSPDGEYWIDPSGNNPMHAYCDMQLMTELCTEIEGLHQGRTREGSNLDYIMTSVLDKSAGICEMWAIRTLPDERPFENLYSPIRIMDTCEALGFVGPGIENPCPWGSEFGTCGYDISNGFYNYGDSCGGCALNDGIWDKWVLMGPVYKGSVNSSMDGSYRQLCMTR